MDKNTYNPYNRSVNNLETMYHRCKYFLSKQEREILAFDLLILKLNPYYDWGDSDREVLES